VIARDEIATTNEKHWNRMVEQGCGFTVPWLDLDRDALRRYGSGELESAPEVLECMWPAEVLAGVKGKDVLCLAGGGGQQSAVLGLLGARVTVVDLCQGQLDGDIRAATHYGYDVSTIQADMRDLSCIPADSLDLVYQAESMAYVPDAREVYAGVARAVRAGGLYRVSFCNPVAEFAEWDGKAYCIDLPYAQKTRPNPGGAAEFRHHMSEIFNGLIDLGFRIQQVQEDPGYLRLDPPPAPGSWDHFLTYLPGFVVVARKG